MLNSLGIALMVIAGADIVLSWAGFDVARKLGFGKFSPIAPYVLFFIGIFLLDSNPQLNKKN